MVKSFFDIETDPAKHHCLIDRLDRMDKNRAHTARRVGFLRDAFARLDIPLPGRGEYIETVDAGHLLFINQAGCTIRIQRTTPDAPPSPPLDSEFVLQPLGRIDGPGLSLSVNPGLPSPWGQDYERSITDDLRRLAAQLKQDNILFFDLDARGDNIGYLPFASPDWPRGVPVVIDPGAIAALDARLDPLRALVEKTRALLGRNAATLPQAPVQQATLYGDLRHLFNTALAKDGSMKDFWSECIETARMERLYPSWDTLPESFKSIPAAARAYQDHLRRAAPAFRPV